jgi:hypothetical protein
MRPATKVRRRITAAPRPRRSTYPNPYDRDPIPALRPTGPTQGLAAAGTPTRVPMAAPTRRLCVPRWRRDRPSQRRRWRRRRWSTFVGHWIPQPELLARRRRRFRRRKRHDRHGRESQRDECGRTANKSPHRRTSLTWPTRADSPRKLLPRRPFHSRHTLRVRCWGLRRVHHCRSYRRDRTIRWSWVHKAGR